jgi:predicted MPP superfamily phosphohydrolase
MRLRILSDLHDEFAPRFAVQGCVHGGHIQLPTVSADLTILAGDIANGRAAVHVAERAEFAGGPVVLVAGNHEYYGGIMDDVRADMVSAAAQSARKNIYVLQQQVLELGQVRVLGTTLWTDYSLAGRDQRDNVMAMAKPFMADYRLIQTQAGRLLVAPETVAFHERELAWLRDEIAKPWEGKTVVVSHHAPHPLSVAARFAGNAINGGFVSDLSSVMPGVDLWVHGHTHDGFDYRVKHADGRNTRVVANPAGYRKRLVDGSYVFENPSFDPGLTVQL